MGWQRRTENLEVVEEAGADEGEVTHGVGGEVVQPVGAHALNVIGIGDGAVSTFKYLSIIETVLVQCIFDACTNSIGDTDMGYI